MINFMIRIEKLGLVELKFAVVPLVRWKAFESLPKGLSTTNVTTKKKIIAFLERLCGGFQYVYVTNNNN